MLKIAIPPSKSQTLRALLFGALARGQSVITNPLFSPDSQRMREACTLLGAQIVEKDGALHITGTSLKEAENVIDAGNSGIVLRFVAGIAALSPRPIVITGDHSIRTRRPIAPLLHALKQLGARAEATKQDGFAPVIIQGPIRGGTCTVDGSDSQPVSALLLAGALLQEPLEIHVTSPGEIPWVEMTLAWLDRLGVPYTRKGDAYYCVRGRGGFEGFSYHVSSDLSSLAFPLVAALIQGVPVTFENIAMHDGQGDKEALVFLEKMGAHFTYDQKTLIVHRSLPLQGISMDINRCIDALPILAIAACFARGTTVMTNASSARHKESDRIAVMATELRKMGARLEEHPDGLTIHGGSLQPVPVCSYGDHRVAMALAVATHCLGKSPEEDPCMAKTYPDFLSTLVKICK